MSPECSFKGQSLGDSSAGTYKREVPKSTAAKEPSSWTVVHTVFVVSSFMLDVYTGESCPEAAPDKPMTR